MGNGVMSQKNEAKSVREVESRLRGFYAGLFVGEKLPHGNRKNPLNELLFIICSNQTSTEQSLVTYRSLRRRFPRIDQLAMAGGETIERALWTGGRQSWKARFICGILRDVTRLFGWPPTLAPLRQMDDRECESALKSLDGVGSKTARCVMMYSLAREVFPVDTHCRRICRRLGWLAEGDNDDNLQDRIPGPLRYSLHVTMLSLGREICTAKAPPNCDMCPIGNLCPKIGVAEAGGSAD